MSKKNIPAIKLEVTALASLWYYIVRDIVIRIVRGMVIDKFRIKEAIEYGVLRREDYNYGKGSGLCNILSLLLRPSFSPPFTMTTHDYVVEMNYRITRGCL